MSIPSSFIKNVAIRLRHQYKFSNSPWQSDQDIGKNSSRFIGRRRHIEKLKRFLDNKKGVYLVTGYRGMGKTSFVNYTIGLLKKEREVRWNKNDHKTGLETNQPPVDKSRIIPIHLTIAQQRPEEIDILRQVVISVYDEVKVQINKEIFPGGIDNELKLPKEKLKSQRRLFRSWLIPLTIPAIFILLFAVARNTSAHNPVQTAAVQDTVINKPDTGNQKKAPVPPAVIEPPKPVVAKALNEIAFNAWYLLVPALVAAGWFIYYIRNAKLRRLKNRLADDELYIRIKWMVERAFSTVSEDLSEGANAPLQLEFKGFKSVFGTRTARRVKGFPVAGSKELEYELKMILQMAAERNYQFIFVFDELDKIDFPVGASDLNMDLDKFDATLRDANFQTVLRNRKQAVMNIIAGLKNFFTTAEAAFIFIAGREMFDASLADISDKQSPLSSIFTYTFNIESFMKEEEGYEGERNGSSLTNAIEEIIKYQLCTQEELDYDMALQGSDEGFIPDPEDSSKRLRLREIPLFNYLKYAYYTNRLAAIPGTLSADKQAMEMDLLGKEYSKLYFTIQAFISFLAYRSNGSPKKILKSFHEFVRYQYNLLERHPDQFVTGEHMSNKSSAYSLVFNYQDQARTGFINYLYRPFLVQHGRNFKLYSDNAVISVPYLFDHLFKFHAFAFSRPNLELVPELLSTNKTPSIKEDLNQIITYLSDTHLRETNIELFEYKFNSRFSNEISFLSRLFEEEAAAFNFTLDESYAVKLLLNEKIKELRSIYARFQKDAGAGSSQIYSIAYHNGNLGDLNFFDQEYDDAIGSYSDAIRPINHLKINEMNRRDFVTLVRNKLKIGLCLEKINSYEEALAFFSDAAQDALRYINYRIVKLQEQEAANRKKKKKINAGNIVLSPQLENEEEKEEEQIVSHFMSSSISSLLQIVIQSTMACIYVQEKFDPEGMTSNKIRLELMEFFRVLEKVKELSGQVFLQSSNYFYHHGRIAYYKNSRAKLSRDIEDITEWKLPYVYLKKNGRFKNVYKNLLMKGAASNLRQPTQAFIHYMLGLDEAIRARDFRKLAYGYNKEIFDLAFLPGKYNLLKGYLEFLHEYLIKNYESYTANHYKAFSGLLTSIGDCLLSMYELKKGNSTAPVLAGDSVNANTPSWKTAINEIFILQKDKSGSSHEVTGENTPSACQDFLSVLIAPNEEYYSVGDVLRCYYLAAKFYKKAGRVADAGFEYRKILHTIRVVVKTSITEDRQSNFNESGKKSPHPDQPFIDMLEKEIVKPALALHSKGIGRSHRHMLLKANDDLTGNKTEPFLEDNIAHHPDTREIKLLFEYIKLKVIGPPANITAVVNPYNSIATQFTRILELNYFAATIYYGSLKKWLESRKDKRNVLVGDNETDEKTGVKIKEQIRAFFFSNHSLIHSLQIYGSDYMLGHSFTAYSHYRIANFLRLAGLHENDKREFKDEMDKLVGNGSKVYSDEVYHYGKALDHYEKIIELHTAGEEYRKTIRSMIYLEDDFSDCANHFGAALDRFMMVHGVFSEHIKECVRFKVEAGGLGAG